MSKAAVKISGDLLSNPLCEQDQAFLESMTSLDTAMRRMDSFNQEKVSVRPSLTLTISLSHSHYFSLSLPPLLSPNSSTCEHSATWQVFILQLSSNTPRAETRRVPVVKVYFHLCRYCITCV